ncbi:zinc ribbon domain-containing protein [Peptoniphilus catoniae]|uniref:zinc ribbon domain-containing protein n=1 Tax=Peptoniphilus catoniae TaxID=1660341 RepID=UPI0010FEDAE4|nr:zinc ribbon domain-containing protein [Peptoniphilus catoniae]
MFCPNCGNEVSPADNYCKVCGKNLKNVKVTITQDIGEKDHKETKTNEATRVFRPVKIDGIDTTNRIKDIIEEVDKKISKNINDYEANLQTPIDLPGPKKIKGAGINTFSKKDLDSLKLDEETPYKGAIIEDEFVKENSENKLSENPSALTNFLANIKKDDKKTLSSNPKEKKSLKQIWKDFINEDDDEYSIFSQFDKDKKKDKSVKIASTTYTPESMETTMDIPKDKIEEALRGTNDADKKSEFENKSNGKKDEVIEDLNTNIIFDENNKNYKVAEEEAKTFQPKKYDKSLNYKEFVKLVNEELDKPKPLEEEKAKAKKEKEKDSKKEIKAGDFKNSEVEISKPVKNSLVEDKISNEKDEDKTEIDDLKAKEDYKKEVINKSSEPSKDKSEQVISYKDKKAHLMNKFSQHITKFYKLLKDFLGKKSDKTILAFAAFLSALPIILAERKVSFAILFLILAKVLFKIVQFYTALNLTTDKVWIESSPEEVRSFSTVNYMICEFVLLVGFLISPWDGLKLDLLSALTALPIAMIVVAILSVSIASGLYWNQLKKEGKIDFIAWYLIIFLIFELASKLFFIFTNLIVTK